MFTTPLRLTGVCRASHIEAVSCARDALGSSGASILDFHMFSNAILCLNFDIAVSRLRVLEANLAQASIHLDQRSLDALELLADGVSIPAAELPELRMEGSLSINVINDEPTLRIEVPAVPG